MQAIDNAGADILSIVTLTNGSGLKEAVVRLPTIHPAPVVWALGARGVATRQTWRG